MKLNEEQGEKKYEFENGKYTIVAHCDGEMSAFRHGELWMNLTGDKLTRAILDSLDHEKARADHYKNMVEKRDSELGETNTRIAELKRENEALRRNARQVIEDGELRQDKAIAEFIFSKPTAQKPEGEAA